MSTTCLKRIAIAGVAAMVLGGLVLATSPSVVQAEPQEAASAGGKQASSEGQMPADRISRELKAAHVAQRGTTSYAPVSDEQELGAVIAKMKSAKPQIEREHQTLLEQRYDLSNRPAMGVTMSRGKSIQGAFA